MPKKTAFLAAFAISGQVSQAAKAVGMERGIHYRWLRDDPEYPALFAEAETQAGQMLLDEATRRAKDGVQEPVIYQGRYCYRVIGTDPETGSSIYSDKPMVIVRRSDMLLWKLVQGRCPEFRDKNTTEVTGKDGGAIEQSMTVTFVSAPKPE